MTEAVILTADRTSVTAALEFLDIPGELNYLETSTAHLWLQYRYTHGSYCECLHDGGYPDPICTAGTPFGLIWAARGALGAHHSSSVAPSCILIPMGLPSTS